MPLISAENLKKSYRTNIKAPGLKGTIKNLFHAEYKEIPAIAGVSFSVDEGQSIACIGENGAGKSTLVKMLVGILQPTAGELTVYGKNPMDRHMDYLRRIGVVFGQKTNLWWDIPVVESYNAVQVLYKLDKQAHKKRMDEVIDRLSLGPILESPARKLSLGQRMKADIGFIFLHHPRILYLDEPTIGLDINVKHVIRKFIREMNREDGVTVFLTSHDLADIDQICDRALVLSRGKVHYQGGLTELKNRYVTQRVVTVSGAQKGDIAQALPGAEITQEGRKTRISYAASDYATEHVLSAVSSCFELEDIGISEPDIDYVVSKIFQEGARQP